jgi:hypothetical protein
MEKIIKEYIHLYNIIEEKAEDIFSYYSNKCMTGNERLKCIELTNIYADSVTIHWENCKRSGVVDIPLEVFIGDDWKDWIDEIKVR